MATMASLEQGGEMHKALWSITYLGAILGAILAVVGVMGADGAPEEAATAAIGIALAATPYVLARANDELKRPTSE